MPTLLDLCDIAIPDTVDGLSMVGEARRPHLYGEIGEDAHASRMLRKGPWKLIWYPVGNHLQLFDLEHDPHELVDLAREPAARETVESLCTLLLGELYGSDERWVRMSA